MTIESPCKILVISALIFALPGCASLSTRTGGTIFQHDILGEVVPWTDKPFDSAADKFTFAVFSDLTGGERKRIFEIAVAQLSLLRPELIINVGDLIEGGTQDPGEIKRQWDSFDKRANRALAPVFYVGGNHDLSGEVLQDVWDRRHGRRYYHFVYKDVLFLVLDTEDNKPERMKEIIHARNQAMEIVDKEGWGAFGGTEYANMPEQAAGNITVRQSQYFQQVLAANPDVRWTFLFMHKAPWTRPDEQNFAAIEQAMSNRAYTVFNGHVHAYEYERRYGRDYIRLATTGGVQLPERGRSADHVTLVTVSNNGADIANLLLEGILDKTGHIPLGGDDVCFEVSTCPY